MVERFTRPQMINGMKATAQGDQELLARAKESPPYLHDGRH